MPAHLGKALQAALHALEAERARIEHQIAALKGALEIIRRSNAFRLVTRRRVTTRNLRAPRRGRPPMSRAARQAVSRRMKAYWAKRRALVAKARNSRAA